MKGETLRYEVKPHDLKTGDPFSSLFPINPSLVETIAASIKEGGYDPGQPIAVWHGLVVDGHTRLKAAKRSGLGLIPCMYFPFEDEDEALRYALSRQRDRRNLTDADLIRLVGELDKRRSREEQGRVMGKANSAPCGAQSNDHEPIEESEPARSSSKTAKILGISERKVERIRTVLDRADDDVKAAVLTGEKSVNAAYNETVKPLPTEGADQPRKFRYIFHYEADVEAEEEETAILAGTDLLNSLSPAQIIRLSKVRSAA